MLAAAMRSRCERPGDEANQDYPETCELTEKCFAIEEFPKTLVRTTMRSQLDPRFLMFHYRPTESRVPVEYPQRHAKKHADRALGGTRRITIVRNRAS